MDEQRKIGELEVAHAIHIGDKETLFLLDPQSTETPYLVCYNTSVPGFGFVDFPSEMVGGADYLEAMEEFLRRVQGQIDQVRTNRQRSNEPQEVFGAEHCLPDGMEHSLVGCVVVMKPEVLRHEYQNVAHQLLYVIGGFGAAPNARGSAVFANNVFSGEKHDCRRHQILGVLDPAKAPSWAKPGVEAIRMQRTKEKGGKPHEL